MESGLEGKRKGGLRWLLAGAIASGVGASVCCLGPFVLLALGVSGAWIGALPTFERYRPLFTLLAVGLLGFAFYQVYRKPKAEACAPGSYCANPRSDRINKTVLWVITFLVAGSLAFPDIFPRLFAVSSSGGGASQGEILRDVSSEERVVARTSRVSQATLVVKNMTCASCTMTVRGSLTKLPGVEKVNVTLDPPRAVVLYDPGKVSLADLTQATAQAGYPSLHLQGSSPRKGGS